VGGRDAGGERIGGVQRIVIAGGGFAGLWSAAGAARRRGELGVSPSDLEITLINRDGFHAIRVRNYEADLSNVRVALDAVLDPIGVRHVAGVVTDIDLAAQEVGITTPQGRTVLPYDRLVMAAGSEVVRPPIPGLADHVFSVDTFDEATRLDRHIAALRAAPVTEGRATVLVVGAGLTGVETACEMPARLRAALPPGTRSRVILADHASHIGSTMGDSAIPVIREALDALGIEQRAGVRIVAVDPEGATLDTGERIAAGTIVWTAGMQASALTALFPVERDRLGRLPVDQYLRVEGVPRVFAAGDAARLLVDGVRPAVMSCQHARPMGRFAGHNVVSDLLGHPLLPLRIDWYVTVLDLGPWGALYTHGWDRRIVALGPPAKRTKELINCVRIYPPLTGNPQEILDAARPTVQPPPERYN
jgi:NADH:ubiquinone reductase (H+-translocating)